MIYLYVVYCIIYIYICIVLYVYKISKLLQAKPNQMVFFLFPNLSKNFQPELTCAVCSKCL